MDGRSVNQASYGKSAANRCYDSQSRRHIVIQHQLVRRLSIEKW